MRNRCSVIGVLVIAALCLGAGCARNDGTPRIVCNIDGKMKPTAFTFGSFREALEEEHGAVEADGMNSLKTRSVEVYFRKLENGTLLAEQVYLVDSRKTMDPAELFGLREESE